MKQGNAPAMRNRRRQRVLERLTRQLQSGVANGTLTEVEIKRIEKEVEVLRKRTTSEVVALGIKTKKYRGAK